MRREAAHRGRGGAQPVVDGLAQRVLVQVGVAALPRRAARLRECAGSTQAELPASVCSSRNPSTTAGASGMSIAAPVFLFGKCDCLASRFTSAHFAW